MLWLKLALYAALVVALALRDTSALRVTKHNVVTLPNPAHSDTDRLVQEWTVTTEVDSPNEQLESIVTRVGCQVYVSYAPASDRTALATVRVVGDNAAIIQRMISVAVSTEAPCELQLDSPGTHQPQLVSGEVRVELVVHTAARIQRLHVSESGNVVVDKDVLAANDPSGNLTLVTSSSGDLFLPPQLQVTTNVFQLRASGSGGIRGVVSDVTANALAVYVDGSGDVKLGAGTLHVAGAVSIESRGSGSIDLYVARFRATALYVVAMGSGDIRLRREVVSSADKDDVDECDYRTSGSASIRAGSIVCTAVQAVVQASGDITVQAKQSLTYAVTRSGDVFYTGDAPLTMTPSTVEPSETGHRPAPIALLTPQRPVWFISYHLPTRKTSLVTIGDGFDDSDDIPAGHVDDDDDEPPPDDETTHPPASTEPGDRWEFVVVVGVVVVVLWGGCTAWNSRRRTPKSLNERTPLINEDTPVYI